jgi:hypothetical protein
MNESREIRAKSLEIAVSILGGSTDTTLDKYLPLAGVIEEYIKGPQGESSVGKAKTTGV